MYALRTLLVIIFLGLTGYTIAVVNSHGTNLFPAFLGDIQAMGWPGQFNVDFASYLLLSALWIVWRHEFSIAGLRLAAVASIGGGLFLSIYLLTTSFTTGGDIRQVFLGSTRFRQAAIQ